MLDESTRLRLLLDAVQDYAIYALDVDGCITSWNVGAERMTGYAAEEVIGRHFSLLYPEEQVRAGKPGLHLAAALSDGRFEVEGWRVRKDGSRYWTDVVLTPLRAEDGTLLGFVKITRDLTERRRAEILLESVLDNVLDAIIGIDHTGIIQSFNRAAERIFGYRETDVLGQNMRMLMPEPDRSRHDQYLRNYLETGHAKVIGIGRQVTAQRSDGTSFPADLAVSEFVLDGQRYFTGVIRDVTEQRKLENQLRQAQKMEAVGRLAGGVAHDFNNLLTVINSYTAMLLDRADHDVEEKEMLASIAEAGDLAARLTRQLLVFSRQAVFQPQVTCPNDVVRETEKMLRRVIGEDVELKTVLPRGISAIRVDPGQMQQVLINLAINARDAMPQGGRLTLETADVHLDEPGVDRAPGNYVMIAVTDTGHGMTEEVRSHAFEPFFTTKGPTQGTGLGLATVYGIVKQSGGHIDLYSEVGLGTAVKIYLPAVHSTAAGAGREEAVQPRGGSETILLVEDDRLVRKVAQAALAANGYHVLAASGGEEALRIAAERSGQIDLLLTDVVMPGMSGRQLAEEMWELYGPMKVLYMSGYTDASVVRHGLLQAEVAFLQKPYTPRSLTARVREVLDDSAMPTGIR